MTTGRHVAAKRSRSRAGRRRPALRMLQTAAAGSVAVAIAVIAAGGTYAFYSDSATTASGMTLTAGNAALSVTSPLAVPATALYPGLTVAGTAAVRNTGTVPLQLRVAGLTPPASATAFSGALVVGVSAVATTGACTAATTPARSGTFTAVPTGAFGGVVAPGATSLVCVTVTLPASAPAGAAGAGAASFSLAVNGVQSR